MAFLVTSIFQYHTPAAQFWIALFLISDLHLIQCKENLAYRGKVQSFLILRSPARHVARAPSGQCNMSKKNFRAAPGHLLKILEDKHIYLKAFPAARAIHLSNLLEQCNLHRRRPVPVLPGSSATWNLQNFRISEFEKSESSPPKGKVQKSGYGAPCKYLKISENAEK